MMRFSLILVFFAISASIVFPIRTQVRDAFFPKLSVGDSLLYEVSLKMNVEMDGTMGSGTQALEIGYQLAIAVVNQYAPDSLEIELRLSDFHLPTELAMMVPDSAAAEIVARYIVSPAGVELQGDMQGPQMLAQMLRNADILSRHIFPQIPAELLEKKQLRRPPSDDDQLRFGQSDTATVSGEVLWQVLEDSPTVLRIRRTADSLYVSGENQMQGITIAYEGVVSSEETFEFQKPEMIVQRIESRTESDMDMTAEGQMQMGGAVYNEVTMQVTLVRYHRAK